MSTFSQFFKPTTGSSDGDSADTNNVFLHTDKEIVGTDGNIYLRSGIIKKVEDFPLASKVNKVGETWTDYKHNFIEDIDYNTMIFVKTFSIPVNNGTGGMFVIASDGEITKVLRSLDGNTWTEILNYNLHSPVSIKRLHDKYVILGNSDQGFAISTSDDLITWATTLIDINGYTFSDIDGSVIDIGSLSRYIMVFHDVEFALISNNLVDWESITLPSPEQWTTIVYGGKFAAIGPVGTTNELAISDNGYMWTRVYLPIRKVWKHLKYNRTDNTYYIADDTNYLYKSTNLTEWQRVDLPSNIVISTIEIRNNTMCVVCKDKTVLLKYGDYFANTLRSRIKSYESDYEGGVEYSLLYKDNVGADQRDLQASFIIMTNTIHAYKSIATVGSLTHTPNLYHKVGTYDVNDPYGPFFAPV